MNTIRLKLFPFSLKDKAKTWWLVLKSAFLSRFYIIILHLKYH
jgi:hypothetical protein